MEKSKENISMRIVSHIQDNAFHTKTCNYICTGRFSLRQKASGVTVATKKSKSVGALLSFAILWSSNTGVKSLIICCHFSHYFVYE